MEVHLRSDAILPCMIRLFLTRSVGVVAFVVVHAEG